MEKMSLQKNYKPYLYIGLFLAVFAAMFAINFFVPINQIIFIKFYDIQVRSWTWSEIIICALASYYVLKLRKFKLLDLLIAIVLGVIVNYTGFGYVSAISTAVCYYSACQIFRKYNKENKYFEIGTEKIIKSLLSGAVLAIPFAIINNLAIYMVNHQSMVFNMSGVLKGAFSALSPGISEEIIFHFFLLAFATWVFKGDIPKNKATIFLVYFMCVVPHCLIHLPVIFTQNFGFGVVNFLFISLLFGAPMVWLIKNKNLQTAIAFHWMIDFIRFTFVVWNNSL